MKPWKLQNLALKQVKNSKYRVAVLPMGSCEPHDYHLPYGSDAFHSEKISERVCEAAWKEGAKVVLLPTIPYGTNTNTMGFPLTINVNPSTLFAVLEDIVRSLEHHGIMKLLIINGHGGNDFKPFVREIHGRTKVFVCFVNWWTVGKDVLEKIFDEPGDHAGELETSVGLALFPELVSMKDASNGKANVTRFEAVNKGWVHITRPWHLLTESSGVGNPHRASTSKGERYLRVVVGRISKFVKKLSDAKINKTFPF